MKPRAEKDKKYEERHKEERKARSWGWGTSVPREKAEEINEFLKKNGYIYVQFDGNNKDTIIDAETKASWGEQAGAEFNTNYAAYFPEYFLGNYSVHYEEIYVTDKIIANNE